MFSHPSNWKSVGGLASLQATEQLVTLQQHDKLLGHVRTLTDNSMVNLAVGTRVAYGDLPDPSPQR